MTPKKPVQRKILQMGRAKDVTTVEHDVFLYNTPLVTFYREDHLFHVQGDQPRRCLRAQVPATKPGIPDARGPK
jgi:hypothetical protein